jgi:hypothetical protein
MTPPPRDADTTASAVLEIVLDDHPAHFHVEEIIREVVADPTAFGDRSDVDDAVRDLARAGLLHCSGDFVFATRAAVRAAKLGI